MSDDQQTPADLGEFVEKYFPTIASDVGDKLYACHMLKVLEDVAAYIGLPAAIAVELVPPISSLYSELNRYAIAHTEPLVLVAQCRSAVWTDYLRRREQMVFDLIAASTKAEGLKPLPRDDERKQRELRELYAPRRGSLFSGAPISKVLKTVRGRTRRK